MHKCYLSILSLLLAIKAVLVVFAILHSGIGLGPDEAQYWTWSQDLDWGYYSKPPGIAWEIALGTSLFGNTEFGVRSMPVLIGFFLPFVIYLMAKRCALTPAACFWAASCMAFSPIGLLASFLAITDGAMVLCWSIACAYVAGKIEKQEVPNYCLMGLLVLLGALFKWPIYLLWIAILASWPFFPTLRSPRIFWGIGLSFMALLPSLYWNISHEWATFRHVFATLAGGHGKAKQGLFASGNPLEFLGAQAVLVSPILFGLLMLAWKEMRDRKKRLAPGVLFCGGLSFFLVMIGALVACLMKIQGNWVIFAYPSAFVLLASYAFDRARSKKKWLMSGVVFSTTSCALVLSLPYVQSNNLASSFTIPYRLSPFRHNVGWNELAKALKKAGYDENKDFLFGDKYQTASILSFYGPRQKRAYFFNLQGSRKNQFSFWRGMDEKQKGQRGFFAVIENIPQLNQEPLPGAYLKALSPYFKSIHFIGVSPLFRAYGSVVKGVLLFECEGYTGLLPSEITLY